jgi:hypothetical protein
VADRSGPGGVASELIRSSRASNRSSQDRSVAAICSVGAGPPWKPWTWWSRFCGHLASTSPLRTRNSWPGSRGSGRYRSVRPGPHRMRSVPDAVSAWAGDSSPRCTRPCRTERRARTCPTASTATSCSAAQSVCDTFKGARNRMAGLRRPGRDPATAMWDDEPVRSSRSCHRTASSDSSGAASPVNRKSRQHGTLQLAAVRPRPAATDECQDMLHSL